MDPAVQRGRGKEGSRRTRVQGLDECFKGVIQGKSDKKSLLVDGGDTDFGSFNASEARRREGGRESGALARA